MSPAGGLCALGFTPQSYTPRSICFRVSKVSLYMLLSILNKTINQISASDLQSIITRNVNPQRAVEDSLIARIGGDEFVAYLKSVHTEENIAAICERIRRQTHSIVIHGKPLIISIGAIMVQETDSYDTLYRMADQALYAAKRSQCDQFHLAQRAGRQDQRRRSRPGNDAFSFVRHQPSLTLDSTAYIP